MKKARYLTQQPATSHYLEQMVFLFPPFLPRWLLNSLPKGKQLVSHDDAGNTHVTTDSLYTRPLHSSPLAKVTVT